MTATFWTASAVTFTNGQKTATVTAGSPFNSTQSYSNWKLTAGNKNEPVEVKSASGTEIELYDNWSGPNGSTTATMEPSAAAAASAGAAAQEVINQIKLLLNSASVTAAANSFVKRDSRGGIKAASPLANDDVVNKVFFDSNIPSAPQVFGVGSLDCPNISNLETEEVESGLYKFRADTIGSPPETFGSTLWFSCEVIQSHQDRVTFDAKLVTGTVSRHFIGQRLGKTGPVTWVENFNTGNANFNEFGGTQNNDGIGEGYAANSTIVWVTLALCGISPPTSITATGTFALTDKAGIVIRSGIPASDLSMVISTEGSRTVTVRVSNNSGLSTGDVYFLLGETTSSKIIVNS